METSGELKAPIGPPITWLEYRLVQIPEPYVSTVSGGMAGAVSALVSCPLDVIKTKLQAQGGFRSRASISEPSGRSTVYRGIKGTAWMVLREDGLRGFYRGLSPLLLGYVPTWAVYLSIYNRTQEYFKSRSELGVSSFAANVYASLIAGASSTTITNPIWVIKTRLMSQSNLNATGSSRAPWHYNGVLDAIRKMYVQEGLRSFYSGLTPALLGLTHVAVQFPLYEIFKAKFTGIESGRRETVEERAAHFWGLASAVFLSKITASTATYPHEVVRTRLQTQTRSYINDEPPSGSLIREGDHSRAPPTATGKAKSSAGQKVKELLIEVPKLRGTLETCRSILKNEGWRGFYAGLGTNLLRAIPSAMTTLLTFEYLKRAILTSQEETRAKMEIRDAR